MIKSPGSYTVGIGTMKLDIADIAKVKDAWK